MITKTSRTKGEFILEYAGELIPSKEANGREEVYTEKGLGSFLFYFGKDKW